MLSSFTSAAFDDTNSRAARSAEPRHATDEIERGQRQHRVRSDACEMRERALVESTHALDARSFEQAVDRPAVEQPSTLPLRRQRRQSTELALGPIASADCEYMRVRTVSVGCMARRTQTPENDEARK